MKNRSSFTIFTTIFSVLACFGLAFGAGSPESPDPSPFPVNSNTADGFRALENSDNAFNSAFGWFSLFTNTDAFFNTGLGAGTLFSNDGADNTAVGTAAMFFNTAGHDNTAVGINALRDNDSGSDNTALGSFAGFNITGDNNVVVGPLLTGLGVTSGHENVLVGRNAGAGIQFDILNVCIGDGAGSSTNTFDNNIYIGHDVNSTFAESNAIRIGADTAGITDCYIQGIYLNPTPGIAVYVDSTGHLSTTASSRRFKDEIKPMDKTSEAIFALKPVTFRYKKEIDPTGMSRFGLVAEDVEKVNPDLIARDREGKVYTVRYDQVNAMLLNEFLKEHKKVEQQQASIAELKNEVQTVVAQLKEQAAQIQKVSAQVEMSKPAPQVVANKP